MDQYRVISQAFSLAKKHRVLWIFGGILAFGGLAISVFANMPGTDSSELQADIATIVGRLPQNDFNQALSIELMADFSGANLTPIRSMVPEAGRIAVAVLLGILLMVLTLVARAALIRGVAKIADGDAMGLSQGLELGRSGRTFRLLGIDILGGLLFSLLAVPIGILGFLPRAQASAQVGGLQLTDEGQAALTAIGALTAFCLLLLVVGFSWLAKLWAREILIDNAGVGSAMAEAFSILRRQPVRIASIWASFNCCESHSLCSRCQC